MFGNCIDCDGLADGRHDESGRLMKRGGLCAECRERRLRRPMETNVGIGRPEYKKSSHAPQCVLKTNTT